MQFRSGYCHFRLKLRVAECENDHFRTAMDRFDLLCENLWQNTGVFKLDTDAGPDPLTVGVWTP